MIHNANRDFSSFNNYPFRKTDSFIKQAPTQEPTAPKTPKSNPYLLNSRPSLKLSFINPLDNKINTPNKTHQTIRHSCFVGNIVPQRDQENKAYGNLNTSFRLSQCAPSSPPRERTQNTEGILTLIEELQKRVTKNTEQITQLQQKTTKDKRVSLLEGEVKELKAKLLQMEGLGNKNEQYECKLLEQRLKLKEIKDRVSAFNPIQHMKKFTVLESKLNELYEGFMIRQKHYERELAESISHFDLKTREYINAQIMKLSQPISNMQHQYMDLHVKIQKMEVQFMQKMKLYGQQTKRSNRRSENCVFVHSKQVITVKQNNRQTNQQTKGSSISTNEVPLLVKETKYFIDREGYLLDEDGFYLLNSKNQQILLSPQIIECLRRNGMLQESI